MWFQCRVLGSSVDGRHDHCTMGMCAMPLAHTLADDRNGLCSTYLTTVRPQDCAGQRGSARVASSTVPPHPHPIRETLDLEPGQTLLWRLGTWDSSLGSFPVSCGPGSRVKLNFSVLPAMVGPRAGHCQGGRKFI